ncbi:unnamed protein product [Didymodactylos carnosus]|uniref:Uncharacterized protein n=1 Tax=Didymodactylos carnosus TaxID=1234261 RepID=A0A8S2DHI3_9BILA|nr:unnamed protein product [Didymodactylos carnosus]CAF3679395.1 unnamed protein product [Didymodactylos carnosus]
MTTASAVSSSKSPLNSENDSSSPVKVFRCTTNRPAASDDETDDELNVQTSATSTTTKSKYSPTQNSKSSLYVMDDDNQQTQLYDYDDLSLTLADKDEQKSETPKKNGAINVNKKNVSTTSTFNTTCSDDEELLASVIQFEENKEQSLKTSSSPSPSTKSGYFKPTPTSDVGFLKGYSNRHEICGLKPVEQSLKTSSSPAPSPSTTSGYFKPTPTSDGGFLRGYNSRYEICGLKPVAKDEISPIKTSIKRQISSDEDDITITSTSKPATKIVRLPVKKLPGKNDLIDPPIIISTKKLPLSPESPVAFTSTFMRPPFSSVSMETKQRTLPMWLAANKPLSQDVESEPTTMNEATEKILKKSRARRRCDNDFPMTQFMAQEQLRLREKLMRKPKPLEVTDDKKQTDSLKTPVSTTTKRKLVPNGNDLPARKKTRPTTSTPGVVQSSSSKSTPITVNAFDQYMKDVTETFTRITITNTTTTCTTTAAINNSSSSVVTSINTTSSPSSTLVSSVMPLSSTTTKKKMPRKIHLYDDYLMYILKWPVQWLQEAELEQGCLYRNFLGENISPTPIMEVYDSFYEYEEITLPWMLEETWEQVYKPRANNNTTLFIFSRVQVIRDVKITQQKSSSTTPVELNSVIAQARQMVSGATELKCQILTKRGKRDQQLPMDDDLIIVTLNTDKKLFGLIRNTERILERAKLHKSFADNPDVKAKPPSWSCSEYQILICNNGMKINDGSNIRIKLITSLTATLRRFRALSSMRVCPLFEHLLTPQLDDPVFQISQKQIQIDEKHLTGYNDSQQAVISEAFSIACTEEKEEQAKVYMVQGPPGTGKSQTITGIVRAVLKHYSSPQPTTTTTDGSATINKKKKMKILICAPSNGGCNEIVRRLLTIDTAKQEPENGTSESTTTTTTNNNNNKPKLPFKLIRCARGGTVSEDIESVSIDILAQKRLEEELNNAHQHETLERNIQHKVKTKQQLETRIADEKKRLGSNSATSEQLKDLQANLHEVKQTITKLQQTSRKSMPENLRRQREREIKCELLESSDIVVSTLNYVGNTIFDQFCPFDAALFLKQQQQRQQHPSTTSATTTKLIQPKIQSSLFNLLIIDEAAQCLEIDSYIPLRLGINRIILVGDPEQLPATVLSKRALDNGLNQSLFERLYKLFKYEVENPIKMLNIQYRMHDEICKFPSLHIYRGKLQTDKLTNQKRKKFHLKPYIVLDVVDGQEEFDNITQSYYNKLEVQFIVHLVKYITEKGKVPLNQIGIITPYAKQVQFIRENLMLNNLCQKLDIGTVDSFQGRQKDVILLSCVRATQQKLQLDDSFTSTTIGFVSNRQRLNVSITRAKYAMYIVGHLKSLTVSDDWSKLISNARQRNCILELKSSDQLDHLMKSHLQKQQQQQQSKQLKNMFYKYYLLLSILPLISECKKYRLFGEEEVISSDSRLLIDIDIYNRPYTLPYLFYQLENLKCPCQCYLDFRLYHVYNTTTEDETTKLVKEWFDYAQNHLKSKLFVDIQIHEWTSTPTSDGPHRLQDVIERCKILNINYLAMFDSMIILLEPQKLLSSLILKDKPLIAPLLRSTKAMYTSTFWLYDSTNDLDQYQQIYDRVKLGCFKVNGGLKDFYFFNFQHSNVNQTFLHKYDYKQNEVAGN